MLSSNSGIERASDQTHVRPSRLPVCKPSAVCRLPFAAYRLPPARPRVHKIRDAVVVVGHACKEGMERGTKGGKRGRERMEGSHETEDGRQTILNT
ncbi:hypothetical protein XA68_12268 [Ophiocordyceps unilateralis]|uniref:Uncharacterized protein n=1 Tax=Ophiocordyceps unilateralis TaxID=268505 RepID=A0A2A9PEP6_OPHUN|nr:hypothetical protein XA68_12268 [Ophiocordyceps unilateralis]